MDLEKLLRDIDCLEIKGDLRKKVCGVKYDSREVMQGDIFICISGYKTDGHLYVGEAIRNGAFAVVAEKDVEVSDDVTLIKVSNTRIAMADLAAGFYNNPSKKLKLIGITGTNGKTTITYLIKEVMEKAGNKVGLLGTISNMIGKERIPSVRTTPESPDLQKLLHEMAERKVEYVVMEVSSHALKLHRVGKCQFNVAVFTNISHDHLDFHSSLEEYIGEKQKLFKMLDDIEGNYGIVNNDDGCANDFENAAQSPVLKYSIGNNGDYKARNVVVEAEGTSFLVEYPGGNIELSLKLTGLFSVYNSLAAFAVCKEEGVPTEVIRDALEGCTGVPGRFEKVDCGQDFTVIVDYAHSPISLENVLETAKGFARGKIITVFGCGGDRDRSKRPLMGEVAARNSDFCIITSDNPRTEDPDGIICDIIPGVEKYSRKYQIDPNREKAIEHAVSMAASNDIIIIAGKGHETYQEVGDEKLPFDDKEVARKLLER